MPGRQVALLSALEKCPAQSPAISLGPQYLLQVDYVAIASFWGVAPGKHGQGEKTNLGNWANTITKEMLGFMD